jgi:hypothetical protein
MVTDMINSMHESFLLVIIAFNALALIAAANRAYRTDAWRYKEARGCRYLASATPTEAGFCTVIPMSGRRVTRGAIRVRLEFNPPPSGAIQLLGCMGKVRHVGHGRF